MTRRREIAAKRILKWYRYWNRVRKNLLRHVVNDVCFYSQEPYDKKTDPGPYFYHIQDEKTVYEFEPGILCDYILDSDNPENPFSREKFTIEQLKLLDLLARLKRPTRDALDLRGLARILETNQRPINHDADDDLTDDYLRTIEQKLTANERKLNALRSPRPPRQHHASISQPNSEMKTEQILGQSMLQLMRIVQRHPIQIWFEQNPTELVGFVRSQTNLPEAQRDWNWINFMKAIASLCAQRFEYVNAGGNNVNVRL